MVVGLPDVVDVNVQGGFVEIEPLVFMEVVEAVCLVSAAVVVEGSVVVVVFFWILGLFGGQSRSEPFRSCSGGGDGSCGRNIAESVHRWETDRRLSD